MKPLRMFWDLLKPFRKDFLIFLLIMVVYEALQIVDSYILSLVIQLLEWQTQAKYFIYFFLAILVFDEIFNRLDNHVDFRIVSRLVNPIYKNLKQKTRNKFLKMEMDWHHQQQSGVLLGKVQSGTDKILDLVMDMSWEFGPTIIQFFLSLIPLIVLSPASAAILLIALAIYLPITIRQHKKLAPLRKKRHDGYEKEWHYLQEMVSNIETVTLYNLQRFFTQQHDQVLHEEIEIPNLKQADLGINYYSRWRIRVNNLANRLILVYLVWQVTQGDLTIASMVFVWTLVVRMTYSFWRIGRMIEQVNRAFESTQRIHQLLQLTPFIVNPAMPIKIPDGPVTIEFQNVCFAYDGNGTGIHDLNLNIQGGETVAIVGPSGAGKTTLLRLMARLWDVDAGMIQLNGANILEADLTEVRGIFAHVTQEAPIFNDTFAFNIGLGTSISIEVIQEAARQAGIHEFIMSCADKYQTVLGERGIRLSGGEKQRVTLARAILQNPRVLVLDEATSSVDSRTEDQIQNALRSYFDDPNCTVILIAHRLATIRNADRILVFDQGRLVEQGTHNELLNAGNIYADLYHRQMYAFQA